MLKRHKDAWNRNIREIPFPKETTNDNFYKKTDFANKNLDPTKYINGYQSYNHFLLNFKKFSTEMGIKSLANKPKITHNDVLAHHNLKWHEFYV